jgi:hypothetical protein
MSKQPTTEHGFRIRPVSEVVEAAAHVGLVVDEERSLDDGPYPYHLLVFSGAQSVV